MLNKSNNFFNIFTFLIGALKNYKDKGRLRLVRDYCLASSPIFVPWPNSPSGQLSVRQCCTAMLTACSYGAF